MEIIPFQLNLPSYSEEVDIEGIPYIFDFSWNSRGGYWSMDIYNRDQIPLILGVKLVLLFPLIGKFVGRNLPSGELYVLDASDNTEDIQQNDFEKRLYLVYFSEEDLESI